MNSPTVSFGGSLIFKNSTPNKGKKRKAKVNDKVIADIMSEEWQQRIDEARTLLVDEIGIDKSTIAGVLTRRLAKGPTNSLFVFFG